MPFWSWATKQKLTLKCPSASWLWNLGLMRKPPLVSSVLTMMSMLKDSPEEHTADLNAGWVTKDSAMGIPLSQAPKSLQFPAISQTSQGWGVWPHVLGEQAHPQQGQKYRGSSPCLTLPALLLPVLFRAPEVQGMCEHVTLMKNTAKHFRTYKRVPSQKWAKVWEEPYLFILFF